MKKIFAVLTMVVLSCVLSFGQRVNLTTQVNGIPFTVSTLPTGPSTNSLAIVTDSLFGNCQTGGGSLSIICEWNGSSWVIRTGASGPVGTIPRVSTCTSNVDTILSTDRGGYISWSDASPCAVGLPQAGTTGFSNNFVTVGCNIGVGIVTITPTTSTVSYSTGGAYVSGASSFPLVKGQCAVIRSDNTNYFGELIGGPVPLTTGTSITITGNSGYIICTSTCTIALPVPVAGSQFCALNDDNVATVITLSALGSSARYENTARTAYGTAGTGTFVSGGAVKDMACLVGRDSTHYLTTNSVGTWTAN